MYLCASACIETRHTSSIIEGWACEFDTGRQSPTRFSASSQKKGQEQAFSSRALAAEESASMKKV